MPANTENRETLKSFFETNDIPTEDHFAKLIDGMLNQADDGIARPKGGVLSIWPTAEDGRGRLLEIYRDREADEPSWRLGLNLGLKPIGGSKPGLTLQNGDGKGLFIEESSGNVGIGTLKPHSPLTVRGNVSVSGASTEEPTTLKIGAPIPSIRIQTSQAETMEDPSIELSGFHLPSHPDCVRLSSRNFNQTLDIEAKVLARKGLQFDEPREDHLEVDGALYNLNSGVYLAVHDEFYIRRIGGEVKFHLQLDTGIIKQEPWHPVGTGPGGYVFLNGWRNYGSTYSQLSFLRDSLGMVHLRGRLKNGKFPSVILELPSGYRPKRHATFAAASENGLGQVEVRKDGKVKASRGSEWISLDGISFCAGY